MEFGENFTTTLVYDVENCTQAGSIPVKQRLGINDYLIVGAFFVGIFGNVIALTILYSSSKPRNSKHVLMLRSLSLNDLVAQVGMCTMKILKLNGAIPEFSRCVVLVLLRAVGLGSGCVALVMALERWMALTRPFLYQQVVTYQLLMKIIFVMWVAAALVTYLPLMDLGVWIAFQNGTYKCLRFREATEKKDIAYAWIFFTFGTGLCLTIVYFNTCVFLALARLGNTRTAKLVRRVSRTMINSVKPQYSTNEELAFARLMAFLCVTFVVCWMPDMICVVWAQIERESKPYRVFGKIADVFKSIHFTVDPYVYVIYQYITKRKCRAPKRRTFAPLKKSTAPPSFSTETTTPTSILLHQRSFTFCEKPCIYSQSGQ